ncbi:MAG: hypothetical protein D6784_17855, partial [Chloroflexi bacterium]
MSSSLTKSERKKLKEIARWWQKNSPSAEELQQKIKEKLGDGWKEKETDIYKTLDEFASVGRGREQFWFLDEKKFFLAVIVVVLIAVGGVFLYILLSPRLSKVESALSRGEKRLASVEKRLQGVDATLAAKPSPSLSPI